MMAGHPKGTANLQLTRHAALRMAQRARNTEDLDLMQQHATPVASGYVMRHRDVMEAVSELRGQINRLEQLRGKVLILEGPTVVTCYHSDRAKQKRLLAGLPR